MIMIDPLPLNCVTLHPKLDFSFGGFITCVKFLYFNTDVMGLSVVPYNIVVFD